MRARTGAAVVAVAAFVLALFGGGGAPADRAAELVPADALLYVHASTDPGRAQDGRLLDLVGELGLLADPVEDFERDVRPWLGDEAAVAVLPEGTLVLLAVGDEAGARAFADRVGGSISDGFVTIGRRAADGRALAAFDDYQQAVEDLDDERSVDAWASRDAAELLGARATTLAGGRTMSAEATVTETGARIRVTRWGGAKAAADFHPQLLGSTPRDAFGYVGVRGLAALGALLPEAAGVAAPDIIASLGPLLEELDGEIALWVAPSTGDPAVTLVTRPDDPEAARTALAGFQGVIAGALTGSGAATGQVPVFVERDLGDGLSAYALTLAGGGELVYAVDGDRIAISTADDGVRRALRNDDTLADSGAFEATVPEVPENVQALTFLAANQLLELADAAGLDASAAYRNARPDLAKISALGAVVRRQGDDTTVELNLLTP